MADKPKKMTPEELHASRVHAAIAKIGIDGAVTIRSPNLAKVLKRKRIETTNLKLRRPVRKTPKLNNRQQRPRATPEMVDGYKWCADRAVERANEIQPVDPDEAKAWGTVAIDCHLMALLQATDDDQFPRQRQRMKHYRCKPMDHERMEKKEEEGGAKPLVDTDNPGIHQWKRAALRLALGYLSELQRECYVMHFGGNLSYRDIARLKGIKPGSAKSHVQRAERVVEKELRPILNEAFADDLKIQREFHGWKTEKDAQIHS